MTPAARVQAAIEILDEVIAVGARRRAAGRRHRPALFQDAPLCRVEGPPRGARAGLPRDPPVGRAAGERARGDARRWPRTMPSLAQLFDGSPHGPRRSRGEEAGGPAALLPGMDRAANCRRWSTPDEWPALARARAARPAGQCRADAAATRWSAAFEGASRRALSPWGLRLPPDTRVDDHPAFADGLVEVQDEGSQLIALACAARGRACESSTCAPGRAARRWRSPPPRRTREILASDTNRARLSQLAAARRAGRGDDRDAPARCADARLSKLADLDGQGRRRAGRCAVQRVAGPGGAIPKGAGG